MEVEVYRELRKIWGKITKGEQIKDTAFDIKAQKRLLDIFQVGDYFYMIVNVRKSLLELVSPEMEHVLGYKVAEVDISSYLEKIHPQDMPYFLNFEVAVEEFFGNLSGKDIFRYKVQYDYRLRCANGEYKRVLHQFIVIQHDAEDVKTFAVDTDITHLKKDPKPTLSFVGFDGQPSFYNVDARVIYKAPQEVFTRREKDVLRALANGMSSTQISEHLRISKHTVDVHRKNILRKSDARSTVEVVRRAYDNGWI